MSADQKIAAAAKKPPLLLIPLLYLYGVARVFAYGVKKYALGNWHRATLDDGAGERYLSATTRHMAAMQNADGTVTPASLAALDDESGLPHIDHAICGLIMLRGIMVKCGALPADPGEGKEPPKKQCEERRAVPLTEYECSLLREMRRHGTWMEPNSIRAKEAASALVRLGLAEWDAAAYAPRCRAVPA